LTFNYLEMHTGAKTVEIPKIGTVLD